jgi:hypothetical protein
VQREHADLMVLVAVTDHLAATGKEDEVGGPVPLLDGNVLNLLCGL